LALAALSAGCATSQPNARRVGYARPVVARVDHTRIPVEYRMTGEDRRYMVAQPPPIPSSRPPEHFRHRPAREAVWIEGSWAYTGNPNHPYEWMAGHWEIPPPDHRGWVPGGWRSNGHGYVFVRGHWE
jgi:hypothetical protein